MWDDACDFARAEVTSRALAGAKAASLDLWPFFALAKDTVDLGQRLDLAGYVLTAVASAHGVPLNDLADEYQRDWGLLAESRKATAAEGDKCKVCDGRRQVQQQR